MARFLQKFARLSVPPDRVKRRGLYLGHLGLAKLAANLGADDRSGRVND